MKGTRRRFLRSAVPAAIVGLGGCVTTNLDDTPTAASSNGGGSGSTPTDTPSTTTGTENATETGTETEEPATPHPKGEDVWPWFQFDLPSTGSAAARTGPEHGVRQTWDKDVPSEAAVQPAFDEERVYVAGLHGLHAYDRETGQHRWTYDAPDGEPSTPALGDGFLYVVTDKGVYKVNAEEGWAAWEYRFTDGIKKFNWLEAKSPPKVVDDAVFVHLVVKRVDTAKDPASVVLGLTRFDGSERLKLTSPSAVRPPRGRFTSAPAIVDGTLYYTTRVAQRTGELHSVNLSKKQFNWQTEYDGFGECAPTVAHGRVYLSDFWAQAFDAAEGTFQWRRELEPTVLTDGLAATDDLILFATRGGADVGRIYALERNSDHRWVYEGSDGMSLPVVGTDTVFVGNEDGTIRGLALDDGDVNWYHEVDQAGGGAVHFSGPVFSEDVIYVTASSVESGSNVTKLYALSAI